jgi:hypothetical protein
MKSRASIRILAIALFVLVLPVELSAQQPRYKIVDIPTLGGPAATGNVGVCCISGERSIEAISDFPRRTPASA